MNPAGGKTPTITTPRLRLTVPCDADLDAVFAIHSDARTWRHRPELVMKTRSEAVELIKQWQHQWTDHGVGYFVVSTTEGKTVGFCGVREAEECGEPVLNLYYRFAPEAQGRGYAAEAAGAAMRWAREQGFERPVVAIIDPSNEASARLAQILGLQRDSRGGVTGDYDVYR